MDLQLLEAGEMFCLGILNACPVHLHLHQGQRYLTCSCGDALVEDLQLRAALGHIWKHLQGDFLILVTYHCFKGRK